MFVYRTFLNDLGGNPNKKNGCNETVLLAACQLGAHKTFSAQERRAACVTLLLQWRGVQLNTGERERIDLTAQDVVSYLCYCFNKTSSYNTLNLNTPVINGSKYYAVHHT